LYKNKHKSTHVPQRNKDGNKSPLGGWVNWQRCNYKKGQLLDERYELLHSIDFIWDATRNPNSHNYDDVDDGDDCDDNDDDEKKPAAVVSTSNQSLIPADTTNITATATATATTTMPSLLTKEGERIILPMHTDPSLISVVIHDNDRGRTTKDDDDGGGGGALGLQYYHPKKRKWIEPDEHGHDVATIFVGSVLAYLTSGRFPGSKHRVIEIKDKQQQHLKQRMAATLFLRPQPSALLQVPLPSPWLLRQIEQEQEEKSSTNNDRENSSNSSIHVNKTKKKLSSLKPPITFDAWLKRVARNYEKQQKKYKKKTNNLEHDNER